MSRRPAKYLSVSASVFFLWTLLSVEADTREAIEVIYPQNPFIVQHAGANLSRTSIVVSANGIAGYDRHLKRTWRALSGLHTFEPVVTQSLVLIGGSNGLYALDRDSGVLLWKVATVEPIFSPVVASNFAYAAAQDGTLRAVDLHTGNIAWEKKLEGWIYTPAFDEAKLILGGSAGRLSALSAHSGELLWSREVDQELVYRPVRAAAGTILITTFDGWLEAFSSTDGRILWRVNESVAGFPPLIHEDYLYMGAFDGTVRARNVTTGHLIWRYQFVDKLPFMPRIYDDQLVVGSDSGSVAVLNRFSGTLMWKKEFQLNLVANPVMVNNNLIIVGERGELFGHNLHPSLASQPN